LAAHSAEAKEGLMEAHGRWQMAYQDGNDDPTPAAGGAAAAAAQPASRNYTVTVWYTASGTRLSSIYTVQASSKNEAEREAQRQWKTAFSWNTAMQFQEAVSC
jgi:hypothetical protein